MSSRRRPGRRPDHWSSPHERARVRAAERLDAPLATSEAAWLETHLAGCPACDAIAEAYVADRLALRELREVAPEPPRDLWARTAAGIERESATRRREPRSAADRRRSLPALGALSGLAVVTVVVIATAISGGFLASVGDGVATSASPVALASQEPAPAPTAMAVGAGKVYWLGAGTGGTFAYNMADVLAVCPLDRQPDCAPFADANARRVTISAIPKFVFQSPIDDQAIVVGTDAAGSDAILVVALPPSDPTPELSPDPSSAPVEPTAPAAGAEPIATITPITSGEPTVVPSVIVSSGDPGGSLEPIASELISPEPSTSAVAIITDVIVVGRSAAYSPDGTWFAFSARPADGSVGPDIYVWHVGDLLARPLTTDHASLFASWVGGSLLGSRLGPESVSLPGPSPSVEPTSEIAPPTDVPPSADASPPAEVAVILEHLPQTFMLDPVTGAETSLFDMEWQPAVDPTGFAVVAWQGTVGLGLDGRTAGPITGNLVIHRFHGPLEADEPATSSTPAPDVTPTPTPTPEASGDVSPSAFPSLAADFPTQIVAAGPLADFDARWDETGSWLGIWIADPIDPTIGRLSLLHFDRLTGLLDRPEGAPVDVTALPGFSIGLGRMAWATPPGQGGEGSRIQIAAWTADEVGAIESVPVEGAIIVQ